jgi:hypothetical protein
MDAFHERLARVGVVRAAAYAFCLAVLNAAMR